MGFSSQVSSTIILEKKSNADPTKDLSQMNPILVTTEIEVLYMTK